MKHLVIFSFALVLLLHGWQSTKAAAGSISLEKPLVVKWKINISSSLLLSRDEKLLSIQPGGNITSISLTDGQILWRNNLGGNVSDTVFKDKSFLIAKITNANQNAENSGTVIAINTDTGTTLWKTSFSTQVLKLLKENETIILLTENPFLSTLNPVNGELSAKFPLDIMNKGDIYLINTKTVLNQTSEAISLYSTVTGSFIWKTNLPLKHTVQPVYLNNAVLLGLEDGYIQAYDINSGKLLWSNKLSNKIQRIIGTDNGLLVNTSDNQIYFVSLSGKIKWKKLLDGKFSNNFLVQNNSLLIFPIGSNIGTVLNLKNGNISNRILLDESDTVAAPPVSNGRLLFVQTLKSLLAYSNY